jgi:Fe-S cluster assembly ATPase SufC
MAGVAFTEEYIARTPLEERKELGLGMAVSRWTQWDGLMVLRVFHAALEDANFHAEAAHVQAMIDKLNAEVEA